MSIQDIEKKFLAQVKKIQDFKEAAALLNWDRYTGAPKKGLAQRSEVIGTLSGEAFSLSVSDEMGEYLEQLGNPEIQDKLSEITKRSVELLKKEYDLNKKIPEDRFKQYIIAQAKAGKVWEEAKAASNYAMFLPSLKEIIEFNREFLEYVGYEGHPYNTFLDRYEPGMTVEVVDDVFANLRKQIVPLLKEIVNSPHQPRTDFIFKTFPKKEQRKFNILSLQAMGYDFEAGRLDETVHPFAIQINHSDVRVTTKYNETDFRVSIFGTIHEGGHALYEQNISADYVGTPILRGISSGIHESQSLFWEKFVGQSLAYWHHFYPQLKEFSPAQFEGVSVEEFYRGINVVQPSFIRIEADELTYPLHVMIRYEIEKGLATGEIQVEDLPGIWNDMMEEYLGIRPQNDSEGVLQDVHWSMGHFGYFPTYALGYIYSAQLKAAMLRDLPQFEELLAKGDLLPIKAWLTEQIHQYGSMKQPLELLQDVTGEGLNSQHLVDYLNEKYRHIYKL